MRTPVPQHKSLGLFFERLGMTNLAIDAPHDGVRYYSFTAQQMDTVIANIAGSRYQRDQDGFSNIYTYPHGQRVTYTHRNEHYTFYSVFFDREKNEYRIKARFCNDNDETQESTPVWNFSITELRDRLDLFYPFAPEESLGIFFAELGYTYLVCMRGIADIDRQIPTYRLDSVTAANCARLGEFELLKEVPPNNEEYPKYDMFPATYHFLSVTFDQDLYRFNVKVKVVWEQDLFPEEKTMTVSQIREALQLPSPSKKIEKQTPCSVSEYRASAIFFKESDTIFHPYRDGAYLEKNPEPTSRKTKTGSFKRFFMYLCWILARREANNK